MKKNTTKTTITISKHSSSLRHQVKKLNSVDKLICNVLLFIHLFVGLHPTRQFTHMETSPLLMKGFKLRHMLGTHGHRVMRNGHLQVPVTPFAERLSMKLSEHVFAT